MEQINWWKTAVFYQIYPRSFCDSNGDGIGDIQGIISKLDYLKKLGIDAIWLSPHYPSPMEDCGYDISDYFAVAPEYGTLKDLKNLISEIHARKMYLVTDLVLNHTSDEHAWFKESRSSKKNSKRDWYIWKPGKNGEPPNKWFSTFGGSAWEFDPLTQEYYYHFFFKGQPDLNWRNPEVKNAMFEMVRFWLDMGVDGFRLDAIGTIYENPAYSNQKGGFTLDDFYRMNRTAGSQDEREIIWQLYEELFTYQHDQPGIHVLMKDLRLVIDEYDHRVLIGETDDVHFYGSGDDELHLVFNFPLMKCDRLNAINLRANQENRLGAIPAGAWPCNTLGNHDSSRMMNRFGNGKDDSAIARINLVALLTLIGTPFLYNGEEIGMTDLLDIPVDQFKDPLSNRAYKLEKGLMANSDQEAKLIACREGRDKCRTPMQWADESNAGFCPENVTPWLPVNNNYSCGINVKDQLEKDDSLLNFYKKLLLIRRTYKPLSQGDMELLEAADSNVLCLERCYGKETILICINFSKKEEAVTPIQTRRLEMIFSNNLVAECGRDYPILKLGPYGFMIAILLKE